MFRSPSLIAWTLLLMGLALAVYFISQAIPTGSLLLTLPAKAALLLAFPAALYPLGYYKAEEIAQVKALLASKLGLGRAVPSEP